MKRLNTMFNIRINRPCLIGGFFLLIVFSSCSITKIEKRRYRPGFHIETNSKTDQRIKNNEAIKSVGLNTVTINQSIVKTVEQKLHQNVINVLPHSTELKLKHHVLEAKLPGFQMNKPLFKGLNKDDSDCDEMLLNDSSVIYVKVLQISEYEIQYRKCHEEDGPIYVIRKSKVASIHLTNGDHMKYGDVRISKDRKSDRFSKGVFILTIIIAAFAFIGFVTSFFIFPFTLVSLIFGFMAGLSSLVDIPLSIMSRVRVNNKWSLWSMILMGALILLTILTFILLFI